MKKTFTKWNFAWLVLLLAGSIGLQQKAYPQVVNSGFETGTLADWSERLHVAHGAKSRPCTR